MTIAMLFERNMRLLAACAAFSAFAPGCSNERASFLDDASGEATRAGESLTISVGSAELTARNSSPPGTTVSVSGTGFVPGAEVRLTFDGQPADQGVADASGQVELLLVLSAEQLPGVYELKAETVDGGPSGSARFAVRTDFAQGGFSANQARFNPYENVIGPDNLSRVVRLWRSANWAPMQGQLTVASGRIFALSREGVTVDPEGSAVLNRVFAAFGVRSHDRLSYALLGPAVNDLHAGGSDSVAAVYGKVYAGASDGLQVFAQNCRTDGGLCEPLWTGLTGTHASSPTVYQNVVYTNSGGRLYAFPSSCAAATCAPLWTAAAGADWSTGVAVYKNTVYAVGQPAGSASALLSAYPSNCRSDGGVCQPLWQSPLEGAPIDTPVLSNDRVFLVFGDALRAYRFDCGVSEVRCAPLWQASGDGFLFAPTVAEGVVYANGNQPGLFANESYGSSAWAVDCRSNGGECTPLFRMDLAISNVAPPSFGNGVLYRRSSAASVADCLRDGTICITTTWIAADSPNNYGGPPVVSDGVIYIPGLDRKLYAYGLPKN